MLMSLLRVAALALAVGLGTGAWAQAKAAATLHPSFAQLEAAGATIGEIVIRNGDIFDTDDPAENNWLFRTANVLHINTRENVVRRTLLFRSGERLRVATIEESERILRTSRNYADVRMRPIAVRDGVVDIEVATQDAWSFYPGLSLSRSGGANNYEINIREYNFLGTGTSVQFGKKSDIDRTGNEFEISNDNAFGTWTRLGYTHARNDDGSREGISVVRPFYALDSRWAAGASWLRNDRIEANYVTGEIESEYRYKENRAEVFGGWSQGLRQGWVSRLSAGMRLQDDVYTNEPGKIPPASLAPDQKLVYPFVRAEWIEDRYQRQENRNQMGRPEFFAMGLSTFLDVGYASKELGSSRDAWVYSGYLGRGFEFADNRSLIASAAITGQYTDGRVDRQQFGGRAQFYWPHAKRFLFYASAAGDVLTHPGPTDQLLLGGDNGLRGFPLRYQSGTQRALFTVEERGYSDIYLWRLFRLGAAAYVDVGRAWGGPYQNTEDAGWLANVGIGLRIFNVRSAFANVLHVDLAFPLDPGASIDRVQFLFKSRSSF